MLLILSLATKDRKKKAILSLLLSDLTQDASPSHALVEATASCLQQNAVIANLALKKTSKPVRVEYYAEKVVPLYTPSEFKSHFRMLPSTFEVCYYI